MLYWYLGNLEFSEKKINKNYTYALMYLKITHILHKSIH